MAPPVHLEDKGKFAMTKPTSEESETLLTPAQVAELFYVAPRTVTRWAKTGKLHALLTPGGHRRYIESEVMVVRETGLVLEEAGAPRAHP